MNENAKKWVEALRSGEWKQAQRTLRDPVSDSFCCLGVACEMSKLGKWDDSGNFQDETLASQGEEDEGDWEEEFLSPDVKRWLGMRTTEGELEILASALHDDSRYTTLAKLNDEGKTFAEIADIIEKHADQLFVEDSPQESGSSGSARGATREHE